MFRLIASPRVLLPLMIFVGILILGMRVSDIWHIVYFGKMSSPTALAETKNPPPPATPATAPAPAAAPSPAAVQASPAANDNAIVDRPVLSAPSPSDGDMSPAEMKLLEQLAQRRDQLDKRTKDLDTREALIKIAEQRVDQKIKEMDKLRTQLQSMVNQLGEAQSAQLDNLVKIYETMKPEEAARIFETLDMPVLLGVIQRMKPARTAPVMAKMAPEKAKELTIALTKQDQLPQVK